MKYLLLSVWALLPFALIWGEPSVSLSGSGGSLWQEASGGAGYWQSGIALEDEYINFDISFARLLSTLPEADTDLTKADLSFSVKPRPLGLGLGGGLLSHNGLRLKPGTAGPMVSSGGSIVYAGFSLPLRLGRFSAEPSYYYAGGSWKEGNFYWFFGKPDLRGLHVPGIKAAFNANGLGYHSINCKYFFADPEIINNEGEGLFTAEVKGFFLSYGYFVKKGLWKFGGSLSWLGARGGASGNLTASNQHYSVFPYLYYEARGDIKAGLGFGFLSARYQGDVFYAALSSGVVHIFEGEFEAAVYYKEKALFGGKEQRESLKPLSFSGLGAALFLLDAGIELNKNYKRHLPCFRAGVKKLFAIPWNTKRPPGVSASGGGSETGGTAAGLARMLLLSGLSFYGSVNF